jgi:hypothetical protein
MTTTGYYRPLPVDFLILETLPAKGMIGGLRWAGRRAKDLRTEILDGLPEDERDLPMSFLQSRLRAMHVAGLIEGFGGSGTGGTQIWAVTPEGSEFLSTKEEVLGA